MTLGEDACLLHAGSGPTILGMLRDTALSVLRSAGCSTIASRLRHYSQYPQEAVALVPNHTGRVCLFTV